MRLSVFLKSRKRKTNKMRKLLILLLLLFPTLTYAQGSRFDSVAQRNVQGFLAPIAGATITVCTSSATGTPCTPLVPTSPVTLCTDSTCSTAATNPFLADSNGNWGFWALPGTYKVSITAPGVTGQLMSVTLPCVAGTSCVANPMTQPFTVTGLFSPKNLENVKYVDPSNSQAWAGTDLAGWVASAFASCTNSACTVWVSNGSYSTPAASIVVGVSPCVDPPSTGYGQTLILDTGVTFTQNFPILVRCGASLTRHGTNQFGGWIIAGASHPAGPMIDIGDATANNAINASVTYMRLNANSVAGVGGIRARQINDASVIRGNEIQNNMGDGISVDGTSGVTGDITIAENFIAASASATLNATTCIKLNKVFVPDVRRNSCVVNGAGNKQNAGVYVTGAPLLGTNIFNLHCEQMTDCVKTDSAGSLYLALIDAGNGTTNTLHIAAGGTGTVFAEGLGNNGNGAGFPVVKNDISGTSISSGNPPLPSGQLPFYSNVAGDEFWMDGTQILYSPTSSAHLLKSFGNMTAAAFLPNVAGLSDAGSTSLPLGNLWLGTAATNNFKFQPAATAAARTVQINDPGATSAVLLGGTNLLVSPIAPTISSGFGTSASITASNGTASFAVNVGTGGTATNGVVGLPTAAHGWACSANDVTTQNTTVFLTKQVTSTTTSATLANFNTAGALAAWVASDILEVHCFAN
jgi:hypothetical protein